MPFNAGGQTYIGGQLLAQGLGDFGKGIGGGIMEALEEQRKKQQFTDQIMLQALQSGHATPEQYLEYSKKNTKGKQDYAMTIAANFADEYKERVKEQHQKTQADIAQSVAATDYNKMLKQHQQQQIDIANQQLSDPGPVGTPEEDRRNKFGLVTVWDGSKWVVKDMAGSTAKTISPYAHTPQWSQDGKRIIGYYNESGSLEPVPTAELERQTAGEGGDTITAVGVPDPFRPGKFLPDKIQVIGPGKKSEIVDYNLNEGSPYFLDPETNILTYKKSRQAVPGDVVLKSAISQEFLRNKGGDTGGGQRQKGDAGSGVQSTYGWLQDLLFGPGSSAGGVTPTPTPSATPFATPSPTPAGTPLDQIIQQMSPTPTGTPAQTATPSGTPLDQIVKKITETAKAGAAQKGGKSIPASVLRNARDAVKRGANVEAVKARLQDAGYDASQL